MANTTRRKKLERTPDGTPPSSQKFICCRCGTAYSRQKGYFPVSHSPMYRGTGHVPMCNDCVDEMYEFYREELGDDRAAMRRICMKLDLYWDDAIYDMVERTAGVQSRVRSYIGKANIIRYVDKSFDDTLREEAAKSEQSTVEQFSFASNEQPQADTAAEPNDDVDQSIIDFWGAGYPPDMYAELERHYRDWTGDTTVTEPSARSLYRQICLLEVLIARDSAQGRAIDKNVNALNSLLGSMNLKPSQKKEDADGELERMPLGVGIQKWEYNRPLPETPKKLRDIRGTIRNITTWYLGHVCKMVGVKNSYCKMYEDAMDELRVKHPEYDEEDDDTLLNDIFGSAPSDGGE